MMLLGYEDFIFIPIAKCGSTTVKKTLLKAFGPQWDMTSDMAADSDKPKIVMWREPHDRMESVWRFFTKKGDTIDDFCTFVCRWIEEPPHFDHHMRPQADFVGRSDVTEPFFWDWDGLERRLGVNFPKMNASPGQKPIWDRKTSALFEDAYAEDLRTWHERR